MRIGVVGGGVVGRATARSLIEHVDEVRVYDALPERRTHSLPDALACTLVFVCLPTPQEEGGYGCNAGYIESFFKDHAGYSTNFVLRSTVPIGTTRRLAAKYNLVNLVHSPEFLTARCSLTDAHIPSRNIIGTPSEYGNHCGDALETLYSGRFFGVPLIRMESDESEAVKLILNSFFAVKVAFFNEAQQLSHANLCRWGKVLEGILSDGRVAHSHTQVPGPDGKYGFGGECLPKDLANFVRCSLDKQLAPRIATAALLRNVEDRKRG